jgi:hypothetical protein
MAADLGTGVIEDHESGTGGPLVQRADEVCHDRRRYRSTFNPAATSWVFPER